MRASGGLVPLLAGAGLLAASAARPQEQSAPEQLVCLFETLPPLTLSAPQPGIAAEMRIDQRPPAPVRIARDDPGLEMVEIDGHSFRFRRETGALEIRRDGVTVAEETGTCAVVGGAVNPVPLDIGGPTQADAGRDGTGWQVEAGDGGTVHLRLDSDTRIATADGLTTPVLHLRCLNDTTAIFIVAGGRALSDDGVLGRVDYRIDDTPAAHVSMSLGPDGSALGLWTGRHAIPFVRRLFGATTLVVGLADADGSPLAFVFDIRGLDAAIAPLRKACNW